MLGQGNNDLTAFALSFCQLYITSPKTFLSYYKYSRNNVIEALKLSKTPVNIIMGGSDNRVSPDWPQTLIENQFDVQIIKGASHFFDQEHEFDLFDRVEAAIIQ